MEITSTTATTTSAASTSASALTSDFETFLKLLTVQMQNQDPLNPTDSSDYAVQLATFSSVEQQVLTNDLLTTLNSSITTGAMSGMSGWIGNEVLAVVPVKFDGAPVTLQSAVTNGADTAELVVLNSSGEEVQRRTISLTEDVIEWDGLDSSGIQFPDDSYSFYVTSYAAGAELATTQLAAYAEVVEVRREDGVVTLILEDGTSVAADDVTGLRPV